MENIAIKPHKITKESYGSHVVIDKGDKSILKVYRCVLRTTMLGALHILLGVGARCFEEKHDQEIRDLEQEVRIQAKIIVKYIEKYGHLRREG